MSKLGVSGQKPVVHCERINSIEHCLDGTQVAYLSGIRGHPRLGDTPWVLTSQIVSIETKNTVYVIGKATTPQSQSDVIDGCTESNCKRCHTHPDHRGDMEHAGIGSRPPPQAKDSDHD